MPCGWTNKFRFYNGNLDIKSNCFFLLNGRIYLVGVSFPFCVLLAFELLADATDGDSDADTDIDADGGADVAAAAAAAAALLRDVIGEMTADLPPGLTVLLR